MISKWGVKNFRSILEAKLDLAPLTIFTGKNNSGKSAFLQSIAMMAQSLKGDKKSIELNGDYVKLGNFEENYSNNDPEKTNAINIYFESGREIYVSDKFGGDICIISHDEDKSSKALDSSPDDSTITMPVIADRPPPRVTTAKKRVNSNQNVKDNDSGDEYDYPDDYYDYPDDNEKVEPEVEVVKEYSSVSIAPYSIEDDFLSVMEGQYNNRDDFLSVKKLEGKCNNIKGDDYIEIKTEGLTSGERLIIIRKYFGSDFLPEYFGYLIPIRNPSKPLEPIKEDKYVNSDGSNTFAVLYKWYREQVIKCLSPDDNCEMKYDPEKKFPFIKVLDSWLKYFDLSDTCSVEQLEKKIKMYINGKSYYLSQLGTGISQILPIFVMCLIAPKNSTIVIQEPEAHFHPKVQSRLADFFIAMALTGRQCIIETHSEYLIEQLRYRIVMLSDLKPDPLHKLTKLYFVTENGGISHFKNIEMNEYAVLDEWPDDFFDETQIILDKIFDEAMKKEEEQEQNE